MYLCTFTRQQLGVEFGKTSHIVMIVIQLILIIDYLFEGM